ncbi:hypothetical protein RB595_008070 [Gaeumannomyces hyphopodioides]
MAPKRKSSALIDGAADADAAAPRRSSRRLKGADPNNGDASKGDAGAPLTDEKKPGNKTGTTAKKSNTASRAQAKPSSAAEKKDASSNGGTGTKEAAANLAADREERRYWLMKAEPETRLENGHDVSFSIDDLASRTVPEPWDGIRNYVARNNLRAMKKGDLAFFYHSNCKEPGIVGTMEVVQEHSPDREFSAAHYLPIWHSSPLSVSRYLTSSLSSLIQCRRTIPKLHTTTSLRSLRTPNGASCTSYSGASSRGVSRSRSCARWAGRASRCRICKCSNRPA